MNTNNIQLLEKSLRSHLQLMSELLNREDLISTEFYLIFAGQLRVLLCDAEHPILLEYAQAKKIELFVYGPRKFPPELTEGLVAIINLKVASWLPLSSPTCKKYLIEDYLNNPIGFNPVINGHKIEAKPHTPKQLIKWVANKEGICHLDFSKPKTFESIKSWNVNTNKEEHDNGMVRVQIIQMAYWACDAIRESLALQQDFSLLFRLKLKKKS